MHHARGCSLLHGKSGTADCVLRGDSPILVIVFSTPYGVLLDQLSKGDQIEMDSAIREVK